MDHQNCPANCSTKYVCGPRLMRMNAYNPQLETFESYIARNNLRQSVLCKHDISDDDYNHIVQSAAMSKHAIMQIASRYSQIQF